MNTRKPTPSQLPIRGHFQAHPNFSSNENRPHQSNSSTPAPLPLRILKSRLFWLATLVPSLSPALVLWFLIKVEAYLFVHVLGLFYVLPVAMIVNGIGLDRSHQSYRDRLEEKPICLFI